MDDPITRDRRDRSSYWENWFDAREEEQEHHWDAGNALGEGGRPVGLLVLLKSLPAAGERDFGGASGKERNDAPGRTRQNAAGKEGKLALSEQGTAPSAPENSWEQGIKGGNNPHPKATADVEAAEGLRTFLRPLSHIHRPSQPTGSAPAPSLEKIPRKGEKPRLMGGQSSSGEGKSGMIPMSSGEPGVGESRRNCAGGSGDAERHLSCWCRAERRGGREIRRGLREIRRGLRDLPRFVGEAGMRSLAGTASEAPQEEGRNLGSWEGISGSCSLPKGGICAGSCSVVTAETSGEWRFITQIRSFLRLGSLALGPGWL